jgi:hypothetical protein
MPEATETIPHVSRSQLSNLAATETTVSQSPTAPGPSAAGGASPAAAAAHVDHGHSVARWVGASLSFIGFLVGGVLFPFAIVPASVIAGVFQIVALVSVVVLNASGFGRPDVWGELKAQAAAERAAG